MAETSVIRTPLKCVVNMNIEKKPTFFISFYNIVHDYSILIHF